MLKFSSAADRTVISDADPQGQCRVTVRFDWQLHDTTSFIRMMFPDAGGTDQVTQNRGYVAIPEVGDQVMVGFVHNHPDRPFVMGGMFHGQIALGTASITTGNPSRPEAATVLSLRKTKVLSSLTRVAMKFIWIPPAVISALPHRRR